MIVLATLSLNERFELTIHGLKRAVADAFPLRTMTGLLIHLIYNRLARFNTEFQKLAAEIRAGKIRPELAPRKRSAREPDKPSGPPDPATPPKLRLPQGLGWLIRRVPHVAAVHAGYMRVMLRDPEMMEMLAVSGRLRNLLRPLCKALMVEPEYLVPLVPAAAVVSEDSRSPFGGEDEQPVPNPSAGSPSPCPLAREADDSDWGSLGNYNSLDAPFLRIALFHGGSPAVDPRPVDQPSDDQPSDDRIGGEVFPPA